MTGYDGFTTHSMLLRCLGWRKRKRDDHTLSIVRRRACQDSFREHRGDSAQTDDIFYLIFKGVSREYIVCGIRNTYGGGASATEGNVWGACWGFVTVRLVRAPRHATIKQCLDHLSFQQPYEPSTVSAHPGDHRFPSCTTGSTPRPSEDAALFQC